MTASSPVGTVRSVTGSEASTTTVTVRGGANVGSSLGSKTFDELVAKVRAEFADADKRLPPAPDGESSVLGLPDAFIEKLARRLFAGTFGSAAFIDKIAAEVVKLVRASHGPTQRNRVALASAVGTVRPVDSSGVGTTRPSVQNELRSTPVAPHA